MSDPFVGVQLGAHSVFDEGADHCLDLLQERAHVNAVMVYTHQYHGFARGRSEDAIAPDHGVPRRDPSSRLTTCVWVQTHDRYYADTFLRHRASPEGTTWEYEGRDVLEELMEPARRRGIRVYGRILEGSGRELAQILPNWPKVLTEDVYGRKHHLPCWNNPHYVNWWMGTVEDLFKTYPLDGFQWGAERVGPLPGLLFRGHMPSCFCQHCCERNRARGTDPERAREGWRSLCEFIAAVSSGEARPLDGVLVTVLRHFLQYPEILAWEYQWRQAQEDMARRIYGTVKAISPDADAGRHIDHQQSTYDTIYRAEVPYEDIAEYADFIKPILYHDIAGPRVKHWHLERANKRVFADLDMKSILDLWYAIQGLDPAQEPSLEEMDERGFSPDYVYRETKRLVDGVGGKCRAYSGIGLDIPWKGRNFPTDPDKLYQATLKAFEAGADGVLASREYDEMRVENLKAFGRAVRDAATL